MIEEAHERLHNALAEALTGATLRRDGLLNRWALVAEFVGPDGERFLHRVIAENMAPWDAEGLWYAALNGQWEEEPDIG